MRFPPRTNSLPYSSYADGGLVRRSQKNRSAIMADRLQKDKRVPAAAGL
ncbi:hypothetical protein B8V81_3377 [Paenibacillus pasadenensis]|uniref:Uncharacterized protein n=1 Tax=Paenibacillus pasadenensis TaxID=217090 RepID=A0A2N5N3M6_9BACL|nr:hypothetical protein B8V81_3377 [Paenibacillus pasadenensis]